MLTGRRHRLTTVRCTEICKILLDANEIAEASVLVRSKRLEVLCLFGLLVLVNNDIDVDVCTMN